MNSGAITTASRPSTSGTQTSRYSSALRSTPWHTTTGLARVGSPDRAVNTRIAENPGITNSTCRGGDLDEAQAAAAERQERWNLDASRVGEVGHRVGASRAGPTPGW